MSLEIKRRNIYVHDAYRKIVLLAICAHAGYALLCLLIAQDFLVAYNICSVVFYVVMLKLIQLHYYKHVVTMIHMEVVVFVILSILSLGWFSGFAMLLIAMASLVYFCPFENTAIPYVISLSEVLVYILLKALMDTKITALSMIDKDILNFMYLLNASTCFFIILYGAYITNISMHLREKQLCEENKTLHAIAYYDQLTGCWTRWRMYESIKKGLIHPTYVVMGDVDDFKVINDLYGHMCGDEVLLKLAGIMKDAFFQTTGIIRWGGEEFVLLFEDEDETDVSFQIEEIRKKIEAHEFVFQDQRFHVTMTFGISKVTGDINDAIHEADERMYQGKHAGKNQLQL